MALSEGDLKSLIIAEFAARGFVTSGEHAYADELAGAIATAVISHIQEAAEVPVTSGSSAGTYPVQ